jgi:hypothetical protein
MSRIETNPGKNKPSSDDASTNVQGLPEMKAELLESEPQTPKSHEVSSSYLLAISKITVHDWTSKVQVQIAKDA